MRILTTWLLLLVLAACAPPMRTAGPRAGPRETNEASAAPLAAEAETTGPTSLPATGAGPDTGALLATRDGGLGGYRVSRVDPTTGRDLPGYRPLTVGDERTIWATFTLSPGGGQVAAIESRGRSCDSFAGGSRCRPGASVLHLLDLVARRTVTTTLVSDAWASPLTFSPDEEAVAVALHAQGAYTLTVLSTAGGRPVAVRALPFEPSLLAFSAAGAEIVAYGAPPGSPPGLGEPGVPRLLLLDAATLETRWEQALPDVTSGYWCLAACDAAHGEQLFAHWSPAAVVSPDAGRLYIVHADAEQLTTVDLPARTVHTAAIAGARSWLRELLALGPATVRAKGGSEGALKAAALSPDGTRLYIVGQALHAARDAEGHRQTSEEGLGVQVVDLATGRRVSQRAGSATGIRVAPGGEHLILDGWQAGEPWTELVDAVTLETIARLDGWEAVASRGTAGRMLLLVRRPDEHQTELGVLSAPSFDPAPTWSVPGSVEWLGVP